ncbi:putative homeobox protein knotted-1-like 3 [Capsicum annuum]|uniref:probable E3 ubiquitin-protein ligase RHY1A n=1 Tax=Capsicum annuum TaxID=4072 RepID=UPI0007BF0F3C|nr:probable E3 ubiquitin-protein ligase RHY1A [Capsicum annuum]XP_047271133.1 probable E3 ubiquitin-protein ligase RHY1A [Capsicum annuum]XP_047271134.1 probable E3 ubiquitin-protein ligase RHY1A [Capsicum annuum]KAF3643971.1 putative homeobox protein knotted-1-like 3 [Capsicum annuum]KAF3664253.1 putative homeobox protein knotted-1-like 3 [Capsicum annuum]
MAGMLPGVECARRRRFHQSSGCIDSSSTSSFSSTRRSSFCLYTSNHEYPLNSSSSKQRGAISQVYQDEKLDEAAREAKQRLDERLSARWKSQNKRSPKNTQPKDQRQGMVENRPNLQGEVFSGLKKSGSKKFNWAKMIWKFQEQDECAICLDQFKICDNLTQLTCAHKFHSKCLVPWLEANAHCPCCRMTTILTSTST